MKNITKIVLLVILLLLSITSPIGQAKRGRYYVKRPIHSQLPRELRSRSHHDPRGGRPPRIPIELPALIHITHPKDDLDPTTRVFSDSILTVNQTSPVSPFQDHSYPKIIPENKVHEFLRYDEQLLSRASPYYLSAGDVRGWSLNMNLTEWAANYKLIIQENLMLIYEKKHYDVPKVSGSDNYYYTCKYRKYGINVTHRDPCCFILNEPKAYYFPRRRNICLPGITVVIDVQGSSIYEYYLSSSSSTV